MNAPHSYDLLVKPWIPVAWRNDAAEPREPKVGITEALQRSHDIRSISHTSPFIEFGLYRLLITIVLDANTVAGERPTIGKIRSLLSKRRFDAKVLGDYFKRHDEGFDLWNSRRPFLQRKIEKTDGQQHELKPIVTLFSAIPSGTNVTHWCHCIEDEVALTEDIAAQILTTVSPFNFKNKPGEARTLAGDPPLYGLVLGKDLFETIVLNLPRPSGRVTIQQEQNNGPVWRTQLDLHMLPKIPTVTQGFTWPVRVIALESDGEVVTKSVNRATYKKPTEKAKKKNENLYDAKYGWRDPNAGVETTGDNIVHIKTRPNVPIWRDAVPLFLVAGEGEVLRADKRRSRPEVISNALRVLDTPWFNVAVYGMRKKGGGGGDVKVEEWFRSILTFPTEVARDSRLSARAIDTFKSAQRVAEALQTALRMLRSPSEVRKTARKAIHRTESDALSNFWRYLELPLGSMYLEALRNSDPSAEEIFWVLVRREARGTFSKAAGPQRRTADGLFRIANARNWLEKRLKTIELSVIKVRKEKKS
jgi:CRISPR type I-E-associated protein CasA/Cse1